MKTTIKRLLTGLALFAGVHQLAAQGTAFSYQGRLNDGTNPAAGLYDFQFQVFDAAVGGTSYGTPPTNSVVGVVVTNGLFDVTLDFGSQIFSAGAARWLQMSVSTNGANIFILLTNRVALLPTPYAIYAASAGTANIAGSVSNATISASALNTAGSPSSGQVLSYNGSSMSWITPGSLPLPYSGSASSSSSIFTLQNTGSGPAGAFLGNVGIGTTSPQAKLQIYGNSAPGPHIPYNEAILSSGDGYHNGFMATTGDAAVTLDMWNGLYGEVSTYNYATGTALPLVLNVNGGNVGIGTTTPAAQLDVNTKSANAAAVSGQNYVLSPFDQYVGGVYGQLAVSETVSNNVEIVGLVVNTNYVGVYGNGSVASTLSSFSGASFAGYFDGPVYITGDENLSGNLNSGSISVAGSLSLNLPLHFTGAGADTHTPVFTHQATVANINGNKSYINNPVCNGKPNAILLITQNWSASNNVGNPKVAGVYYDAGVGQWTIFVVDGTAMPTGVAYNVMVTLP